MYALNTGISDLLAAERNLASHTGDTMTRTLGNTFYSLCHFPRTIGCLEGAFLLHVKVFRVFADDDEVNRDLSGGGSLDGPYISVEVELLPEGDNRRGVACDFGGWGADGSKEGAVTFFLEGVDGLVRESGTCFSESLEADWKVYKGKLEIERARDCFEDSSACLGELDEISFSLLFFGY